MFAYCPLISQATCGISNSNKKEFELGALEDEQIVYSKEMKYKNKGDAATRKYDFCHYDIFKNKKLTSDKIE